MASPREGLAKTEPQSTADGQRMSTQDETPLVRRGPAGARHSRGTHAPVPIRKI